MPSATTPLSYDGRGNLRVNGNVGYSFTLENRLATVLDGTRVAYFATGNLLEILQPAGATRFDHLGAKTNAEYDSNDILKRRYVHGPSTDEPLLWFEGTGLNRHGEYGIPLSNNIGRFHLIYIRF